MKKYQIIGGKYEYFWYGEADTLDVAKNIATRSIEYWDNWGGWNVPNIYRKEDCKTIVCNGMLTHYDGQKLVIPKRTAAPYAMKINGKWIILGEEEEQ